MGNCISKKSSDEHLKRNTDNAEFAIFRADDSNCNGNWEQCMPIKRLLASLKYYSIANKASFCAFIDDVYNVQMLDDYAHLIEEHDEDLYAINQKMTKDAAVCSVETCSFSSRHHRHQTNRKTRNKKLGLYVETMDSLHYYVIHLFECGMRVNKNLKTEGNENKNDRFYDAELARVVKTIDGKRKKLQFFERFRGTDKFTLCNDNESAPSITVNDSYMEPQVAGQLNVKNEEQTFEIYSTGYRFFYWPKYQNMRTEENTHSTGIEQTGGYKVSELYICKKYADFKEEMMNYEYITRSEYDSIIAKATNYLEARAAKKIKANTESCPSHYGVCTGASLSVWNLIALILYTDFDTHCSEFSASFRKLSQHEPLKVTKERNRNFWWMAKTLRETIEIFGKSRIGGFYKKREGMFGPFYTGVDRKMVISKFNIRLCAPTSTTKELSVAYTFGGSNGTIITLNNDSRHPYNDYLRGFDVSWLSRYKDESERLFIGGYCPMRIQSIFLVETKQNFEDLITPLHYFDDMISAKTMRISKSKINKSGENLIVDLFKYTKSKQQHNKMDKYICECFNAFVKNRRILMINLMYLDRARDSMQKLIVHSIKTRHRWNDKNDKTNLIRADLVTMFPNVIYVNIDANRYPFSLLGLLSILKKSKWTKVQIMGHWISFQNESMIVQQYKKHRYNIMFKKDSAFIVKY